MIHKQYEYGGLQLRKSDLTVAKTSATDLKNVQLNYAGELIKRPGFHKDSEVTGQRTVIQMIHYKEGNELLAMCFDGLYKKAGSILSAIPGSPQDPETTSWDENVTYIEINGILFISDTAGKNNVYKYDGKRFYRSGCPRIETTLPDTPLDSASGLNTTKPRDNQHYGKWKAYRRKDSEQRSMMVVQEEDAVYLYEDANYSTPGADPAWIQQQRISLSGSVGAVDVNDQILIILYAGTTTILIYEMNYNTNKFDYVSSVDSGSSPFSNISLCGKVDYAGDTAGFRHFIAGQPGQKLVHVWENVTAVPGSDPPNYTYKTFLDTSLEAGWGGASEGFGKSVMGMNDDNERTEILVGMDGKVLRFHYNLGPSNDWLFRQEITNADNAGDTYIGTLIHRSFHRSESGAFIPMDNGVASTGHHLSNWYRPNALDEDLSLAAKFDSSTYPGGSPNNESEIHFGDFVSVDQTGAPQKSDLVVCSYSSGEVGGGAVYIMPDFFDDIENPSPSSVIRMIPESIDSNEKRWGGSAAIMGRSDTSTDLVVFVPYGDTAQHTDVGYSELLRRESGEDEFLPIVPSVTQRHFRYYYSYLDDKLNIINSHWTHRELDSSTYTFPLPDFYQAPYNQFAPLYVRGDVDNEVLPERGKSAGFITIKSTDHNVVVGDIIYIITYQDKDVIATYAYEPVRVSLVTGTSINVTLELLRDSSKIGFQFTNGVFYDGTMGNTRILFFSSPDEWFNYQQLQLAITPDSDYGLVLPSTDIVVSVVDIDDMEAGVFMDDLYDTTTIKQEIPKCKFLGHYQNHLIGSNVEYPDELPLIKFKNRTIWSDFSIGGSLESFAPFDFVEIGVNDGTELTAIYGTQDNVFMFKEERVFWLSGILLQGQYKVRESLSDGIGCIAHNSLVQVEDGVMFMSNRGLYHVVGGNKPTEISDANEPLFGSGSVDLVKTICELDPLNERIIIYLQGTTTPVKSLFLIYDFYFKQWYIWSDLSITGPMAFYEKQIYIADDYIIRKPGNNYVDNLTVVDVITEKKNVLFHMADTDASAIAGKGFNLSVVNNATNDTTNIWFSDLANPSAQPTEPTSTSSHMITVDFANIDSVSLIELIVFNINTYLGARYFSFLSDNDSFYVKNVVPGKIQLDQPVLGDSPPTGWVAIVVDEGVDEESHLDDVSVEAFYKTGWYDMDMASLRKKFVNFYAYSLLRARDFESIPSQRGLSMKTVTPPDFTLTVKTQINWNPVDKEEFDMVFDSQVRFNDHKFEITQAQCMRLIFYNNLNEAILLTGFEFEWEQTQMKPKGVR